MYNILLQQQTVLLSFWDATKMYVLFQRYISLKTKSWALLWLSGFLSPLKTRSKLKVTLSLVFCLYSFLFGLRNKWKCDWLLFPFTVVPLDLDVKFKAILMGACFLIVSTVHSLTSVSLVWILVFLLMLGLAKHKRIDHCRITEEWTLESQGSDNQQVVW